MTVKVHCIQHKAKGTDTMHKDLKLHHLCPLSRI